VTAIQTARLTILPVTLDLARAAGQDRAEFARLLDARVPDDWPTADFASWLPILARQLEQTPELGQWVRLAIQTSERQLIGDMGFHGPPDEQGTVEIGYSIVAASRRQGYASEGVRALITWAFGQLQVQRLVARCAPDNSASMRILEQAGLRQVGQADPLLHWELRRAGR
jgi:[ribosomal protein S5]-alanine N-acetyltransferase